MTIAKKLGEMPLQEKANLIRRSADVLRDALAGAEALVASGSPGAAVPPLLTLGIELYELAAAIAESGKDPVEVVTRLRDRRPWLDESEAEWARRMAEKFGAPV